ncbi:isocitrate lyase/PEP mutase family protein [Tianweitania sp. BSSL-BM11]|uniref:Isocitrate lyase/PEP mutase family protein n=1 Tax=Tianweitania aestuarii TaxID=2814886 RepID=A0ABS5RZX4_9HYPH|nr:isocitrate lyase/PEP mutase family protein [Tianweitania aestuarii]MBS9721197.1 isocitrate lyase/PEP mutase family protein [Tianweitania aestuarii]
MSDPRLKKAISDGDFVVAPGVFDLISALMANSMDFKALYVTGYGTVASYLGIPDAGIATYRDMLERIAQICKRTEKPIIADADTGYGGLLNVRTTVQGYEAAGVTAIQIEDQEFPKKCGHTPFRRVIPIGDMQRKIEVAVKARKSDDFLVIARTDSRTSLGIDEAIKRGQAYRDAGADVIFVESPESEQEMIDAANAIKAPMFANMVNGGRTPLLSAERLKEMRYAIAIHPAIGFLAVTRALEKAYGDLLAKGMTSSDIDLYSFADMNKLLGFEDVWSFEKEWAEAV